jgi:ATP-dependent DNA helicase RecG
MESTTKEILKQKILSKPLQFLKGVGPKRAELLKKLNLEKIENIFYCFPRLYEDRSEIIPIKDVKPGEIATIQGKVRAVRAGRIKRNLNLLKVALSDGTGNISAVWFNQAYLKKKFPVNTSLLLTGKIEMFKGLQVVNPHYEIIEDHNADLIHTGRIVPIYSLVANLNQRWLRTLIKTQIEELGQYIIEFMDNDILSNARLPDLKWSIEQIHFPDSMENQEKARLRLVFNEFLLLQLGALWQRNKEDKKVKGISYSIKGSLYEKFSENLPFKLTPSQEKVIAEIKKDMNKPSPMQRLLQGDVGSGKTVVAVSAMLMAIENEYQAAIMAPTEILAEQHFLTMQKLLTPLGIKISLLIGSIKGKLRIETLDEISLGKCHIIIGTHALIQEKVNFKKLGLVIVDEQHRFGVKQRADLFDKGKCPDMLIMTATPIPRSLALTVYGNLDISTIDEIPSGRGEVLTYWISENKRRGAYGFIQEEVKKGSQVYVVCPLIEKSETLLDIKAAEDVAKNLKEDIFPELNVALIHGRISNKDKEKIMNDFCKNKINVLVSTTVIEVGIDIPNATVMVVEHAERFGLSQLHQLRGRIGRGEKRSYCLLIGKAKTEESRKRLAIMTQTSDGFVIAKEDLEIRGPGEFFGTMQHGIPELRIGNIIDDMKLLELARKKALEILNKDPLLSTPRNSAIKKEVLKKYKGRLFNIG